ncbi:VRR-NUC domain-containing protein [Paraliobacillus sp. JSM ZJ581]|uniref:VRR-NUC domain-containing protein n=1 Tax=Paraliobacillus sp. JSM ZJ581 TaxID=3342118 RepID=UPI0035A9A93D
MREKTIESKLTEAVKHRKGLSIKLVSPSFDGLPDRLILLPNGKIGFIEVKAPGKKLRPLQKKRKEQLELLGFQAFVLDSEQQIEKIIDEIIGGDAE